jgi:nitrilase
MRGSETTVRIAAVQAAPVFLDRAATVEKAVALIREAAAKGARLVVFPEGFIPAYPLWVWFIPAGDSHTLRELHAELLEQSVDVPGPVTEAIGAAAREAGLYVALGVNERNVEASGTSLYNTLLWFGPDGALLGKHRKLVPTAGERLVHAAGDGSTLMSLHDAPFGKLGGLICWENYMPLARYALYAKGVTIWVAPTWDRGEPWLSTMRHIAKEGRVHVISACIPMRKDAVPDRLAFKAKYLADAPEWLNPGDSVIVDPDGKLLAGPASKEETILVAEIDPRRAAGARFQLDVAGHYGRPDVFRLLVDERARPMTECVPESGDAAPREEPSRSR